ncbi:MAG TPA: hypothetical protein VJA47_00485 [archaeon]|nr:hypothetical protein [archaeon]
MTYNITDADIRIGAVVMNTRARRQFKQYATEMGVDGDRLRGDLFCVEFEVNPGVFRIVGDSYYSIEKSKVSGTNRDCIKAKAGKLGEKPVESWWFFSIDSVDDMMEYGKLKKTG